MKSIKQFKSLKPILHFSQQSEIVVCLLLSSNIYVRDNASVSNALKRQLDNFNDLMNSIKKLSVCVWDYRNKFYYLRVNWRRFVETRFANFFSCFSFANLFRKISFATW